MKRERWQQALKMSKNDDDFNRIHHSTKKRSSLSSLRYNKIIMNLLQQIHLKHSNNEQDKNNNKKICKINKYRYRNIIMTLIYILILLTGICFMSGCIIPMIIFHRNRDWNFKSSLLFSSQLLFSSLLNKYNPQTPVTSRTLTSIESSYLLPQEAQQSIMKQYPSVIYCDNEIQHHTTTTNNSSIQHESIHYYYDIIHIDNVRYTYQPIHIVDVRGNKKNYGNLNIKIRTITMHTSNTSHYHNYYTIPGLDFQYDERIYERMKTRLIEKMNNHDHDMDESVYCRPDEVDSSDDSSTSNCISLNWHHDSYPNCNQFHEISMSLYHPSSSLLYKYAENNNNNNNNNNEYNNEYNMTLLGRGAYRSAYLLRQPTMINEVEEIVEEIVWKQLTYYNELNYDYKDIYKVRIESLIMERLTSSSNIANIYGYCSVSSLVEYGEELTYQIVPHLSSYQKERGRISKKLYHQFEQQYYNNDEQNKKQNSNNIFSFNNFTSIEKLNIIISMAEAIAEMHGYQYGVIVNDDIHPDQWLISKNKDVTRRRYILNDMNNAVFLQNNYNKQQFCPYHMSYGGDFRSPEEYGDGSYVIESVDIWPIGNLIYILLTGVYPYYHLLRKDRKILQQYELNGISPYISPQFSQNYNTIEYHLVSIMNTTFIRQPALRPTIFDILKRLYDIKENLSIK